MEVSIPMFPKSPKAPTGVPDYSFSLKDGDQWKQIIAAWHSTSKNGKQYLNAKINLENLSEYVQRKGAEDPQPINEQEVTPSSVADASDDLPF